MHDIYYDMYTIGGLSKCQNARFARHVQQMRVCMCAVAIKAGETEDVAVEDAKCESISAMAFEEGVQATEYE